MMTEHPGHEDVSGLAVERRGNVAKMVDRLSKDLAAKPPDVAFRKEKGKQTARARFSYSPKHEDELALQVSDVIEVLGQEEEGWLKGRLKNGTTGLFPANFVEFISPDDTRAGSGGHELETSVEKEETNGTFLDENNRDEIQPKKPMKIGFGPDLIGPGTHVVLRPTKANPVGQRSEERKTAIDFVARTSIDRSNKNAGGSDSTGTQEKMVKHAGNTLPKGGNREYAKVEFSYEGSNDDELTLKVGDVITIISKETEDPGWWFGEIGGRKGVFPDNFVKLLPADEVPREKKPPVISPPAVPAKPKPLSGSNRSTTPEPFKPTQPEIGVKAGTAPKSISASSNFLASTHSPSAANTDALSKDSANNGIDSSSSKFSGLPKKPPMLPTSLAKPPAPSPPISQGSTAGNRSSISAKAASIAEVLGRKPPSSVQTASVTALGSGDHKSDSNSDGLKTEPEKLSHPTASRPKQNKRPPSTVFLSNLSKESSPSPDNFSPSSPVLTKPSVELGKGSKMSSSGAGEGRGGGSPVTIGGSSKSFSPSFGSGGGGWETAYNALKAEFEAYKKKSEERMGELEERLKRLEGKH